MNKSSPTIESLKVRLDKWLWAARFYKTRSLAIDAINGGKILLNGNHPKPSKEIGPDALLRIHRGELIQDVVVLKVSLRRGSAPEAALLYEETAESIVAREAKAERFRLDALARPLSTGRPNKQERRQLTDLKHNY